jgi:hypothetical protein
MVRLWREDLEHGSFCGYVGGVGREFFLLWVVGDGITYDGMYVMRHRDVSELEAPDKHHIFIEKALTLKHILPRPPRGFPLDNIREVIQAAGAHGAGDRRACGQRGRSRGLLHRPAGQCRGRRFLHAGNHPDAEWLREVSFFGWDEVSTVSMEDGYAQSLLAVAGAPPPLVHGDSDVGRAH